MSDWKKGELPPVGAKCLARLRGGSLGWMESTFKGGYSSKVWFGTIGCEYTVPAHDVEFKPLLTGEEKAIAETSKFFNEISTSMRYQIGGNELIAKELIDKIKTGEIHGVKWVGEQ